MVPGEPAPKGSRTTGRRKDGSVFSRPASPREKSWVEAVALIARSQGKLPPPYSVELQFAMPRPQKPSHDHPTRGDIDKLARAVLDGLTQGGLIVDDRHVTELTTSKFWALPGDQGVSVSVETIA